MKKNMLTLAFNLLVIVSSLTALTACGSLFNVPGQNGSQATASAAVPVTGGTPSVTVKDQNTDGTSVVVEDVFSQGPGWMVIHAQANGNIGDAIGEAPLVAGDNKNVVVKIDPTKVTPVLYAMLHADVGKVGTYEFPGPDVPIMLNGNMVSPAFNVNITTASAATSASGMSMTTPAAGASNPAVKVSDQQLSGNNVMVDDVVSSGPGWIVIYTSNGSGQPDQAIGHAAVKDGDNPNVMVPVDASKAQGTLIAQLQADKGIVGTFEFPGADEPVMVGAQMIASTFKILTQAASSGSTGGAATPSVLQPSITVQDQQIQNGTVTIKQIVSNGNWWLVIHRQNSDGSMGEYIGYALIKNGINTNVTVKINVNAATPVLYAMLHEDNAPIGVLQFPGPDVPVMVGGLMVAPSFNVTGLSQDISINIHKVSDTVSFLTDGAGISLYISLKDTPGKSNCNADCQKIWKPLIAKGKMVPGDGVSQANLGVITLADGSHQVTYLGSPLYYYVKDVNPGDTSGQGVDGVWFLVTP